jgi:hypothetical protein
MGNPTPPANYALPVTGQGIARCRDLVQLYYGARMAVDVKEQCFAGISGLTTILTADPRRIAYEIVIAATNAGSWIFALGSPQAIGQTRGQVYIVAENETLIIARNFRTELDLITAAVQYNPIGGTANDISTREVFLQPLPVDEPI